MADRILSLAAAEDMVAAALARCNTRDSTARLVARALVAAEADGLKGHGLSRVPSYAAQARSGKVDGQASPKLEMVSPALARIDACFGFAYPALAMAEEVLAENAAMMGIAAAAIRHSHHCGVAGAPVERLAEKGLVALLFANTPAAMAPWGGNRAVFGTNPLAFACPLPGEAPIVVDMSLSKVARGNILAAKQKGQPIPEGWALDPDGKPTTDAEAGLKGTMLPLGDAKGTALALMVELLAAGLTGARFAADASSFLDAKGDPPATGQLLIAFDPGLFGGEGTLAHFARLAEQIRSQPGARLPGARRLVLRANAGKAGLTVPETLASEIEAL